jgi:hypothetical protein
MKEYKVFQKNGVRFIITPSQDRVPTANFQNTSMALAGILNDGDSLSDFRKRQTALTSRNYKQNNRLVMRCDKMEYREKKHNKKNI